ncbi:flagellar biosynthesis protein FlgP [Enterovibrio norvegicus FF-33]|uniref:Flagellar biosynthesis protein FlgP n=1 Tax=Enterovibrio norvegicus FF-454 TaxID=1185651 RepID=A0A1E5C645_9GAMM|nr:LPP20 family lipoprotein [Enterovibrio norvegicus]OEE60994.1 flagellar biosynthesis protein FlgP [Enterovibrio norvegicus FF-454]OEE68208.1 flagellar biosynthesis protein FlgP [Enterovibrio norvegicus FF-33]OEE74966.1 flagellar biosynthesis protein FlgP [Enterovibrio norvegicus FF-162]
MKTWLSLAILMLLTACQPITQMRSDELLSAVGTASVSAQRGDTLEEKQFRAMRASKLEAYKELSEQVYGVRVSGLTQVDDQQLGHDRTSGASDGIIRAAEVIASYQVGDSYVTELQLNLRKMNKMKEYGESHHVPRNDAIIF